MVIHQWNGSVSKLGVPLFVELNIKSWNDVASHFIRVAFDPKELEIKFLNQIQGSMVNNATIDPTTRSNVDGGVQCSINGPTVFAVSPPIHRDIISSSLHQFSKLDHLPEVFCKVNTSKKTQHQKKVYQRLITSGITDEDIITWHLPQQVVIKRANIGLFIIITTQQNSLISKEQSKSIPPNSKKFIFAPFITSSNIVKFKPLRKTEYFSLVDKCKNGIKVNLYNSYLASMNKRSSEHLVDATSIFNDMPNYHGFVQIFAGAGAPKVDLTSKPIRFFGHPQFQYHLPFYRHHQPYLSMYSWHHI